MSDSRLVQADRPTVTRRSFLKVTGAGAAGGALLAMLDARQAPAQLKGTSLRVILWSHFVPAYDGWIDDFAKEWGEQNGATVRIDHIPHLELPARYAAEFAAGAGHDLIYFAGQILTGQYYRHLVDLSDLANDLGTRYGPWMPSAKSAAQVAGVWYDASDNRYLASGVASWIHDAISAFRTTEDTNPKVFKETYVLPEAAGPGGTWNVGEPNVWAIWKFSKNVPAAKEFILAVANSQKEAMGASRGYNMPFLRRGYDKPMPGLGQDAKLGTLQEQDKITAFFGHPGPMTPAAQEVLTTFIVPDMFTRVARGASIDETMKWGVGEIRRIYAKHKAT